MNRRGFLSLLGMGAAGLVLDPERLLWRPGAKTIFVPPVRPVLRAPATMLAGDIFTIEGDFAINPLTQEPMKGLLRQYVITASVTSGERIEPPMVAPMLSPLAKDAYARPLRLVTRAIAA